jgi:hypothetical protein
MKKKKKCLPLEAKGSCKGLEERVRLGEKFKKGDEDEEDMIVAEDELIRVSMGTESPTQSQRGSLACEEDINIGECGRRERAEMGWADPDQFGPVRISWV